MGRQIAFALYVLAMVAAIVGLDLLRNNSLAIDFAGQRLYVGPAVTDSS